jgi:1-acyl-sn-glycerol-3-phosphate acyltransferase
VAFDAGSGRRNLRPLLTRLQRRLASEHGAAWFARDPDHVARWLPRLERVTSYFSPEVRHVERIPRDGPSLVVGNHSCSFYMPDAWVIAAAVARWRGSDAPVFPLIYDLLLAIPGYGPFLRRFGALPADEVAAAEALASGGAVLVFPGGDHDACRPWSERDKVAFGGRTGFVRLALRTGVPVVPAVAHGAHHGTVVLARGEPIARLLRLSGLRVKVLPVMLGPLGPTVVLAPPPLPAQITVEFLPALDWRARGPGAADDPATVRACYEEITTAMQAAMDRLAAERPHPVAAGTARLVSRSVTAGRALLLPRPLRVAGAGGTTPPSPDRDAAGPPPTRRTTRPR